LPVTAGPPPPDLGASIGPGHGAHQPPRARLLPPAATACLL